MATNDSGEQARAALRREHGVRLVTPDEEGTAAVDLPAGVYGFTSSPALASPLFAAAHYRNFEVHRLAAGPAVVGFVTAADASVLTGRGDQAVEIRLAPDASAEATAIVAISYDRIVHHRQYAVRNSGTITLMIAPGASAFVNA